MLGSRVSRPAARTPTKPLGSKARPAPVARTRPSKKVAPRTAISRAPALGRHRPLLLLMVFALMAAGILSRLVTWQVLHHDWLYAAAMAQHNMLVQQPALRGQIYGSDGIPLATDVAVNLLYGVPKDIVHPAQDAALLAPIIGLPESWIQQRLTGTSLYAQLAPRLTAEQSKKIQNLGLSGILFDPIIARDYPEGSIASQVLGYVDTSNTGNYGLEQYYDHMLSGKAGIRTVLKDTAGHAVHVGSGPGAPSTDGANLYLSLDSFVQNAAETELQKAVKAHSAAGGTIIVMDPHTGYILGMASTPGFNPNHYSSAAGTLSPYTGQSNFANPAISWSYEPGSTFKIVTMAAGLDSNVITPQTAFEDTGRWQVGNVTLHNWNDGGFGWETMTQVLQHSANVGASFVSSRLGVDRFYRYVKKFGIGSPTGIDLAGEAAGLLPLPGDKTWTDVNQFTNAFGQGLSTTPLQLIRAVATVANGGVMMKPQMVRRVVYDGHVINHPPVSQGRVISARAAHTLTGMLVQSAVGGEASQALVKGYDIAAKTGTANIPAPGGGYINGATVASITGYAPASSPRFVAMAIIDRPKDTP
ncbi:MAG: peptidoglycan D,D-transpeptidase FtsI family protein, partial [Chloroflexota bacterium]